MPQPVQSLKLESDATRSKKISCLRSKQLTNEECKTYADRRDESRFMLFGGQHEYSDWSNIVIDQQDSMSL